MAYPQGETISRAVASRVHLAVATVTALAAIPLEERADGQACTVTADNSQWVFSLASTASDTTSQLVVSPTDVATGRWIRTDKVVDLKIAVDFNVADAAVLFTVPTGFRLRPTRPFWEIAVQFAGGASSTIGLSSSNALANTKGDLLGGAAGDATAVLTTGLPKGAIGTKLASVGAVVLVAADTLRFDRITSIYTSGSGFAHVPVEMMAL